MPTSVPPSANKVGRSDVYANDEEVLDVIDVEHGSPSLG